MALLSANSSYGFCLFCGSISNHTTKTDSVRLWLLSYFSCFVIRYFVSYHVPQYKYRKQGSVSYYCFHAAMTGRNENHVVCYQLLRVEVSLSPFTVES
jgi:hypothetical protein